MSWVTRTQKNMEFTGQKHCTELLHLQEPLPVLRQKRWVHRPKWWENGLKRVCKAEQILGQAY